VSLLEAILLGLIQGLTEFLPVSSSGHLVVFQNLLGLREPGVTLEVLLHFGTLLSVLYIFRKDFVALFGFIKDKEQRHLLLMLAIGVAVTGIIGLTVRDFVETAFKSTLLVGFMLIVTGGLLLLLTYIQVGTKNINEMKYSDALLIGFMQALAIIPGISRSGSTIVSALWRGLNRESAIRYSFMMAVPVIMGATIIETKNLFVTGIDTSMLMNYVLGGLTAFISGIIAIKTFIKLLARNKFHYFAYYCWALGLMIIIYFLIIK
jgi:undecaprenyl-diphosphatase